MGDRGRPKQFDIVIKLSVTDRMHDELKLRAVMEGLTVNELIRRAIRDCLGSAEQEAA